MTTPPIEFTPDELLRHGGFLRRLAGSLVHDEHAAEDLVQHTFARALQRPPRAGTEPRRVRAWLSRIARNRAISLRREAARRRGREERSARDEALPAAADMVGELELQEVVLGMVKGLDEPYRTAVYLRYYRDLGPKEIARELGVPVATVDTRLWRARARLREALDVRCGGDRGAWVAVLLPWAGGAPPASPPVLLRLAEAVNSLGVSIMGMKVQLALLAVLSFGVVAALAVVLSEALDPPERGATGTGTTALHGPPAREAQPAVGPAVPEGRSVVVDPGPTSGEAADPGPDATVGLDVRCLVLDPDGRPLAAAPLVFQPEEGAGEGARLLHGVSDAAGVCVFPGVRSGGRIVTDPAGEYFTVMHGMVRMGERMRDPVVVAAPGAPLEVRVVNDAGRPLEGAEVRLAPADSFRARFPQVLDASLEGTLSGVTGEDGVFATPRAPDVAGLRLTVRRDGHRPHDEELASSPWAASAGRPAEIEVVLRDLSAIEGALVGRVLDERGVGTADAVVTLGAHHVRSDGAGWFFFDDVVVGAAGRGTEEAPEILALRRGWLPARAVPRARTADGVAVWPEPLVLQFTSPALTIAGRVLDPAGRPLAGFRVFPKEVTLVVGAESLEAHLGGDLEEIVHAVTSDEEGRFELRGLVDRDYEVAAIDPTRLVRGDFVRVAAGARDVVLRVDPARAWERVTGRVVDDEGRPLAGAGIAVWAPTQRGAGAGSMWTTGESRAPMQTDDAGRFVLEDVPRERITLSITHADITPRYGVPLPPPDFAGDPTGSRLEGVELVVSLRLRFQVVLDDPGEADELRVLDEGGEELRLAVQKGRSNYIGESLRRLVDGRSQHLYVDRRARTLVLYSEGREVRRAPLVLEPRTANVVRL